jgi:hypothetical protein
MEAHSLTYPPANGGVRQFSPMWIVAFGLAVTAAGFAAWQFRNESREGRVPLLANAMLPSSELALMEAAFDRAKLSDYTIDEGRILVPKGRQSSYMRALVDAEALPREFGGSLRRALETSSPWQSRSIQDERLRVATQEELSLVLCSMPGIRRAAVLYDAEPHASLGPGRTLGGSPRQTASVNIETDDDATIDRTRARSIRVLVAASIAGLEPEDVAVTDLRSGMVYAGPLEPVDQGLNDIESNRIALEERLAERIRRSLAYVEGAIVDVQASIGAGRPTLPRQPVVEQKSADANSPADVRQGRGTTTAAPAPSTDLSDDLYLMKVHAAVAVPQSNSSKAVDAIREHVLELLPATPDPGSRTVSVTRFHVGTAEHSSAASLPERTRTLAATNETPTEVGHSSASRSASRDVSQSASPWPPEGFLLETAISSSQRSWLAGLAAVALAFVAFLWWRNSRRQLPVADAAGIDWTLQVQRNAAGSSTGSATRAAIALIACATCLSSSQADEPPATLPPYPLEAPVLLTTPEENTSVSDDTDDPQAAENKAPLSVDGMETTAAVTMGLAVLALVGLSWFGKKRPKGVPRDVFDVLGSGQLDRGHRVAVVRFGPKTLLVSIGSSGCNTLSELNDPQATETIAEACRLTRVSGQFRGRLPATAAASTPVKSAA